MNFEETLNHVSLTTVPEFMLILIPYIPDLKVTCLILQVVTSFLKKKISNPGSSAMAWQVETSSAAQASHMDDISLWPKYNVF